MKRDWEDCLRDREGDARAAAETALPRVVLTAGSGDGTDWRDRKNPKRRFKRYCVTLRGLLVGFVTQGRRYASREAGGRIVAEYHPRCWYNGRLSYDTRKEALIALLTGYFMRYPKAPR